MIRLKYIRRKGNNIVLFSTNHDHIDECMDPETVISAGFAKIHMENDSIIVEAYGESTTIGKSSDPEKDSKLIYMALRGL